MPNPENGAALHERLDYCWVRFDAAGEGQIPAAQLIGLTSTQINAGALTDPANAFTAIVIPRQYNIAATNTVAGHIRRSSTPAGVPQLLHGRNDQRPQHRGSRSLNTRVAAARPAENPDVITPGSTYDGTFDTSDPIAWGFDKGGFLYRDQESTTRSSCRDR